MRRPAAPDARNRPAGGAQRRIVPQLLPQCFRARAGHLVERFDGRYSRRRSAFDRARARRSLEGGSGGGTFVGREKCACDRDGREGGARIGIGEPFQRCERPTIADRFERPQNRDAWRRRIRTERLEKVSDRACADDGEPRDRGLSTDVVLLDSSTQPAD